MKPETVNTLPEDFFSKKADFISRFPNSNCNAALKALTLPDYNKAEAEKRQSIENFENNIQNLVKVIQTDKNNLSATITDQANEIAHLQGEIKTLQTQLENPEITRTPQRSTARFFCCFPAKKNQIVPATGADATYSATKNLLHNKIIELECIQENQQKLIEELAELTSLLASFEQFLTKLRMQAIRHLYVQAMQPFNDEVRNLTIEYERDKRAFLLLKKDFLESHYNLLMRYLGPLKDDLKAEELFVNPAESDLDSMFAFYFFNQAESHRDSLDELTEQYNKWDFKVFYKKNKDFFIRHKKDPELIEKLNHFKNKEAEYKVSFYFSHQSKWIEQQEKEQEKGQEKDLDINKLKLNLEAERRACNNNIQDFIQTKEKFFQDNLRSLADFIESEKYRCYADYCCEYYFNKYQAEQKKMRDEFNKDKLKYLTAQEEFFKKNIKDFWVCQCQKRKVTGDLLSKEFSERDLDKIFYFYIMHQSRLVAEKELKEIFDSWPGENKFSLALAVIAFTLASAKDRALSSVCLDILNEIRMFNKLTSSQIFVIDQVYFIMSQWHMGLEGLNDIAPLAEWNLNYRIKLLTFALSMKASDFSKLMEAHRIANEKKKNLRDFGTVENTEVSEDQNNLLGAVKNTEVSKDQNNLLGMVENTEASEGQNNLHDYGPIINTKTSFELLSKLIDEIKQPEVKKQDPVTIVISDEALKEAEEIQKKLMNILMGILNVRLANNVKKTMADTYFSHFKKSDVVEAKLTTIFSEIHDRDFDNFVVLIESEADISADTSFSKEQKEDIRKLYLSYKKIFKFTTDGRIGMHFDSEKIGSRVDLNNLTQFEKNIGSKETLFVEFCDSLLQFWQASQQISQEPPVKTSGNLGIFTEFDSAGAGSDLSDDAAVTLPGRAEDYLEKPSLRMV